MSDLIKYIGEVITDLLDRAIVNPHSSGSGKFCHNILNQENKSIKFTCEYLEDVKSPYLDILLRTSKDRLLNYNSKHPHK